MRRVVTAVIVASSLLACAKREPPRPSPAPVPVPTPVAPLPTVKTTASVAPTDAGKTVIATTPSSISADAAPSTPGCGTATSSPQGMSYTTKSGRTFHVWGPSKYEPARRYPVVLTFHGWYTNGRDFQKWFKMEDHVEGSAFTVYPDSKGPTWDLSGNQDLDFASDMVEALSNAYCIDRTRVFALGFSFGGKLVHHLGCKRPSLVRAISVGDGSWQQETGCRPIPVLVTHRTRDHDELVAWGREASQRWAKLEGCADAPEPSDLTKGCVAYRGCAPPGQVTFCEDTHFDSSWPKDWNHTIREEYRSLTWRWFMSVP